MITAPGIRLVLANTHRTRVFIVHNGQYLLVRHWLGDGAWMLPGGGCHIGEMPLTAARREIKEELGLSFNQDQLQAAGSHTDRDNGFCFTYDLFVIELTDKPILHLQTIEILAAQWFSLNEPSPSSVSPEVVVALRHWLQ